MKSPLAQAISLIQQRWPDCQSTAVDEPIFLLAAGWRSGSTLVQRMLLDCCLMWGEPYEISGMIERLAQPLTCFRHDWPPEHYFIHHPSWQGRLAEKWTADLYPSPQHLLEAHVAFLRRLFAEPAHLQGYRRWGIKAVRFGIEYAFYLRWVFPKARFLFLIRDPYACWMSFRRIGVAVIRRWPEDVWHTPEQFGQHWLSLAQGFYQSHAQVGGRLILYEQLLSPGFDPRPLEEYLGVPLNMQARELRVPGAVGDNPISPDELLRLHAVVGPFAAQLGYHLPLDFFRFQAIV
ncbi:MAG: sulfotransferase [Gemmataceae bacterium]|nr:sulfotransferase [Gemmataceae bacterium]MDW8266385.1 sulfotransferase [Gemmataceae bacterium]